MAGVQTGSWVWSKDYDCLVPKDVYLRSKHNMDLRSDLPSPAIRPDTMPAVKSMIDGKHYDSKSAYYKSVSRAGCEIVGFDKRWHEHIKPPKPYGTDKEHTEAIVADVKRAIQEASSK